MTKIKRIFNNNGRTLMELTVSMIVLAIIMIAATTVFAPMLRTFERANNFAQANTMLDNVSALIMADISNATGITSGLEGFTIRTTHNIEYYTNAGGILSRRAPGQDKPVLHRDFYRSKGAETTFLIVAECEESEGTVILTLTLKSTDGWEQTRTYTAKPVGLVDTR